MRIEKLPDLNALEGVKGHVYRYLMALFLIGGLSDARAILDALKEILATIENAVYREEVRQSKLKEIL